MTETTPGTAAPTAADKELETELKAVRAKRAALEDARTARTEPSIAERLATEKRELAEDEVLDRLAEEHGHKHIELVRCEYGAVIVKRPHLATYRRFQDAGKSDTKTYDQLVRPCVLYPSKAEFDALLEQQPHLLTRCADAVVRLAGVRTEEVQAKQ